MENQNKINIFYSYAGVFNGDEKVLEPIEYLLRAPLPQIRNNVIQAFNHWLKVPNDKIQVITEVTHIIYVAGLMIDDIQDNSFKRFGILSTHFVYGIASTVTAANYATSVALEKIVYLNQPAAAKICTEYLLELARGQGIDIIWRDEFFCPNEEEYKKMIIRKTGAVFNLSMTLMKLFSTYDENFSLLVTILGLYFQIRDDYCNLNSFHYTKDKGYCEDLTEGKFNFVIIHALRTNPKETEIRDILKQQTTDIHLKQRCVQLLEEYGSFEYTRDVLIELDTKAREEIDRLGGNPFLTEIINELRNFDIRVS